MKYTVGSKGQIVISKDIRERLGIQPGWTALQKLVGDHVEMYFLPPEHSMSLKGSLSIYTSVRVQSGEEWQQAREAAWAEAAADATAPLETLS